MSRHSAVLDVDPQSGRVTEFHRLHDGEWAIRKVEDVEPVLDANKEAQNHCDPNAGGGWARQVARIPLIFFEKWRNDYGIDVWNKDHEDALMRLLDDPDWRWLRTDNSTLSKRMVSKAQVEKRLAQRRLWAEL